MIFIEILFLLNNTMELKDKGGQVRIKFSCRLPRSSAAVIRVINYLNC